MYFPMPRSGPSMIVLDSILTTSQTPPRAELGQQPVPPPRDLILAVSIGAQVPAQAGAQAFAISLPTSLVADRARKANRHDRSPSAARISRCLWLCHSKKQSGD